MSKMKFEVNFSGLPVRSSPPLIIDPVYVETDWDPEECAEEYFKRARRPAAFSKRGLWFVSKVKRGPGKGRMRAKGRRTIKFTFTEDHGTPLRSLFQQWTEVVIWEPKDAQS